MTAALLDAMRKAAPHIVPDRSAWLGGFNTPAAVGVPFANREAFIARMRERIELIRTKGYATYLMTRMEKKRKPWNIEIILVPEAGTLSIGVKRPSEWQPIAELLSSIPGAVDIDFAFVDAWDHNPVPLEPGDKTSYRADFATFPHRQCLGWMAYVPRHVTREQLPLAADILQAKGGSIIVTTKELFDISNKEQIKRANQIEMDMNDLGLLAVTDPAF